MTLRLLRVASLGLLVATLVQCKHATPDVAPSLLVQCQHSPAAVAPEPLPLTYDQLRDTLDRKSYVLISADRNDKLDHGLTDAQLLDRTFRLKADLRALGLSYVMARGHYGKDEGEASFLVFASEADQPTLIYLGARYQQDSIIVGNAGKHTLVFTTGKYRAKAYTVSEWTLFKTVDDEAQEKTDSTEKPEQHTDIRTADCKEAQEGTKKSNEGASPKCTNKFKFSIPFDRLFDFSAYKPTAQSNPPVDYPAAQRAFDPSFEVPKVLWQSSCAIH